MNKQIILFLVKCRGMSCLLINLKEKFPVFDWSSELDKGQQDHFTYRGK